MNLENIKNELLKDIIDNLKNENEYERFDPSEKIDIPFITSVLDKYLVTDFSDLLKDIHERGYYINGFRNSGKDEYYTCGYFEILVYEKDYLNNIKEDAGYYNGDSDWEHFDFAYKFEFEVISDTHDDWLKPSICIYKIDTVGKKEWDKGEIAYQLYEKEFYEKQFTTKELEEMKKQERKKEIENEIQKLQRQLENL